MGSAPPRNPITGIVGCGCACAGGGHAAAPPRSVMNSRRLILVDVGAVMTQTFGTRGDYLPTVALS